MMKKGRLNQLYFERSGAKVFITNDAGGRFWAPSGKLKDWAAEGIPVPAPEYGPMSEKGFIRDDMDIDDFAASSAALCGANAEGPSLHIMVLTLKCNQCCVYCRATASSAPTGADMDKRTALRCVDVAFSSPNSNISIEFQGGEALVNWPVLKETVLYAKKKNSKAKKNLALSVVTNLCLMDDEKLRFLMRENVAVCTSLDGPKELHDRNRLWSGGSAYDRVEYWLKRIMRLAERSGGAKDSLPSALMTTTKLSLSCPEKIVDTYEGLGMGGIFLRPLSPIGYAKDVWKNIGYEPAAYLSFYDRAMYRIMEINRKTGRFVEKNAAVIARKMLRGEDPNYLDLRSPCGGAVGQLAYNYNGDVYTCDEGRMIGALGDDLFRLGSVYESDYKELLAAPAAKMCVMASCLENQPRCSRCAYKPYCGVCPVHNYETQGSPWGNMRTSSWCAIQKGVFSSVIRLLEKKETRKIIESWL